MEEIKVGEYVRFEDGTIDRIQDIRNTLSSKKLIGFYKRNSYMTDTGLQNLGVKHSENIIDLIEIGDYVNGIKVMSILDGFIEGTMEIKLANKTKIYRNYTEDIKSIVTKEQFSSVEYRLEE